MTKRKPTKKYDPTDDKQLDKLRRDTFKVLDAIRETYEDLGDSPEDLRKCKRILESALKQLDRLY